MSARAAVNCNTIIVNINQSYSIHVHACAQNINIAPISIHCICAEATIDLRIQKWYLSPVEHGVYASIKIEVIL